MIVHRLDVLHRRCLRKILGISWRDHATNEELMRADMERLQDIATTRRRKTHPYSNVLGARERQMKEGEAEEDMAKYSQRRPGRDGCQLAWSLPDRQ